VTSFMGQVSGEVPHRESPLNSSVILLNLGICKYKSSFDLIAYKLLHFLGHFFFFLSSFLSIEVEDAIFMVDEEKFVCVLLIRNYEWNKNIYKKL